MFRQRRVFLPCLGAQAVAESHIETVIGGFLFVASCSYHAPLEAFAAAVAEGVWRARRGGRVLATTGAGPDHPVHPQLPESAYLKAQLWQVD